MKKTAKQELYEQEYLTELNGIVGKFPSKIFREKFGGFRIVGILGSEYSIGENWLFLNGRNLTPNLSDDAMKKIYNIVYWAYQQQQYGRK